MKKDKLNVLFGKTKQIMIILLVCFLPLELFAQRITAGGQVLDSENEPLPGVNVFEKGTTNGTSTDIDGNFTINVASGSTLVFSFLGFNTQEVTSASNLRVTMEEEDIQLDEVVVIGYGTQRKADITTAVSTVNAKDWSDRPIISAEQALQGKAAGVQVIQPSGKPGADLSVRIRGATSINAGNDPLYVVDGIPTNSISNLSPNDIQSMSILKDASSAAIYGARAANGVVLITTKKGVKGKPQIAVAVFGGFSNVSKKIKTLNTQEYFDLMSEIGISVDNTIDHYTDWAKKTYGTGTQQNYQLSVSGGSDNIDYYISTGYQKEKGIVSPADYDRFSFRSNINAKVKEWFSINSNVSFYRGTKMNAPDNEGVENGGVIMGVLNTPPYLEIWDKNNPGQYAGNPHNAGWENPIAQASNHDLDKEYRFMGNLGLDFKIVEGLHFKPSFSADYTSKNWEFFVDPIKTSYGRSANGRGQHAHDTWLTWTSENILNYAKVFSKVHNFSATAGATFMQHRHENAWMSAEDFVKGTTFKTMTLNMANKIVDINNYKEGYSLVSFLARVQYDFKSRYYISAAIRADGSSKLHPDHRWGYFPSASVGWRFSDEDFFEPLKPVFYDAKLRLSWGQNGNQNGIGNYDYLNKYNTGREDASGNGPSITPGKYGNRDLKWETTTQYNAGLDLSFFNNRLVAEFDLYYKKTKDLLLEINLPEHIGREFPMRNDGEMLNKGIEYNITGYIFTGEFKWDASLNMSFNKNEVKKLGLTKQYRDGNIGNNQNVILVRAGLPLGAFFGHVADGVDPETGDMMYKDINPNGRTGTDDPADRVVIGDAQPDFIFGFTNNFSWKNFTLTAFFQGTYGNDIYNATKMFTEGMIDSKNQSTKVLDRWRIPGQLTDMPRSGNSENSIISSRFVEDGSYFRLKTLTLAYNFGERVTSKLGANAISIYATANNLFTLTNYSGYDPELNAGGGAAVLGLDVGTYPQTRTFIFGINLTF
ncbi:MAG: TonB-dependent receptor [Bacteroidales bacterium]|jgi:TonB-linked SusC/RagA family outer membrane protein|nr:TonB-dependent receptor [Bacteroidales bacterium]